MEVVLLFHLWADTYSAAAIETNPRGCALSNSNMEVYSKDGHVFFGGISSFHLESFFPAPNLKFTDSPAPRHCQKISVDIYQSMLAMEFATNEINQNVKLLPNTSLGFQMFDSCDSEARANEGMLWLISGRNNTCPNFRCRTAPKLAAFIGDVSSSGAVSMARVLGIISFPQISYAAALPILSDKIQFPSFLRTVTSVDAQPMALMQLLLLFGWTWIGILISNNDICLQGSQILKQEAEKMQICIEFFEILPTDASRASLDHIIGIVHRSTATVIVCYTFQVHIIPVLKELSILGVSDKMWIGITSLIPSSIFTTRDLWEMLNGTLGIAVYNREIPGFKEFIYGIHPSKNAGDIFMTKFWEQIFSCTWMGELNATGTGTSAEMGRRCTGKESLRGLDASVYNARFTYSAYNAIYALAHALDDLISCKHQEGPFIHSSCADPHNFQPWQVRMRIQCYNGDFLYVDNNLFATLWAVHNGSLLPSNAPNKPCLHPTLLDLHTLSESYLYHMSQVPCTSIKFHGLPSL